MTEFVPPTFKRRPQRYSAATSLRLRGSIHLAPPTSDTHPASLRTDLHDLFNTPLTTNSLRLDLTPLDSDTLLSSSERRCESYYRLGLLSDPNDPKSDTGVKLVKICGMLYRDEVVDRRNMDTEEWEEEEEKDRLGRLAEVRRAEVQAMDIVKQRFMKLRSGATN